MNMFERFTDRARKVMALANQEAQRFNHESVGTEHILLGLIKEGSGVAATVLKNLDVGIKRLRVEVEKLIKSGPDVMTMGKRWLQEVGAQKMTKNPNYRAGS
jgi:ATP-dependent Clp protease ATP-binding subunit ClpC